MSKYICIHGHFYQPPRENPWLNEVELQESAHPHHDWNKRVSAECYARNASARILDGKRRIVDIVNNYANMSFNFGPTLLSWMQKYDTETYLAILEADKLSQKNFSGHGSALAQAYSHLIMPLANNSDKLTQIVWGIRDFESRFKRKPEGMWLSETAVDLESLDLMAGQGIKFTVLAPRQAKKIRAVGHKKWYDVSHQNVDPKMPYLCVLPSGKTIAIFFYDGPISQAVAFEGLLKNGDYFAKRLKDCFVEGESSPQLVNIATDGETYGHHHKFGDMALAFCLDVIKKDKGVKLTNYGEYLDNFPPTHEVEIYENSSWSCHHGVERWRKNCGCNTGGNAKWSQEWRTPLRNSLDWLRDQLLPIYEKELRGFVKDPWKLRNAYIDVILNRSDVNVDKFFLKHGLKWKAMHDKKKTLKLLEMQHNALLMYTSCGWFFDEVSGIETVQIIKYAARAIQLAKQVSQVDLEADFVRRLSKAKSNIKELKDGSFVYKKYVKPSVVDISRVGAHYSIASLFTRYPKRSKMYCFTFEKKKYESKSKGPIQIAGGCLEISSDITWDNQQIHFVAMHLGGHEIHAGVCPMSNARSCGKIFKEAQKLLFKGHPEKAVRFVKKHCCENYTLWHLFKHEQQSVLNSILQSTMVEIESSFLQIYNKHHSLVKLKDEQQAGLPKSLESIVEFKLGRDLSDVLEDKSFSIKRLKSIVKELKNWSIDRDKENLSFLASKKISDLMRKFSHNVEDLSLLEIVMETTKNLYQLKLHIDLWKAQNVYFSIGKRIYSKKMVEAKKGRAKAKKWIAYFDIIGHYLQVKIV